MLERLGPSLFPLEYAVKLAGISEGDKVAEIGCDEDIGPALMLARVCGVVYAIDKYPDRVKEYKRRLNNPIDLFLSPDLITAPILYLIKRRTPPIRKIQPMVAEAEALPFKENSLAGIVFYHSFDWIDGLRGSPAEALKSTHDSLQLGKHAIFIEYSPKDADEREEMCRDIGFSVERHGNIVLGKKILEKPLDVSSREEYLGVPQQIKKNAERARKTIRAGLR